MVLTKGFRQASVRAVWFGDTVRLSVSGLHLTTHSRSLSPRVPGLFPTYHTKGLLAQLSCAKSKLPATKDQTWPLWLSVRVSKILVFLGWGPEENQPPLSQRLPRCGLHGRGCPREEGHLCWRARLYGMSLGPSPPLSWSSHILVLLRSGPGRTETPLCVGILPAPG